MKSRLEEVEELLVEINYKIHRELCDKEYLCRREVEALVDEKVRLEIEKHELLNKSQ